MIRAVFLDRDGVINKALVINGKPYPPKNLEELEIIEGVASALSALNTAGWLLIVISNQPDVARGALDSSSVEIINDHLKKTLHIDDFRVCYHDDADLCSCRKPLPGSILKAATDYGIDLSKSYMIGDRWRDIEAGKRAGCKTIFIDYGYQEKHPKDYDHSVSSLFDATDIILGANNE